MEPFSSIRAFAALGTAALLFSAGGLPVAAQNTSGTPITHHDAPANASTAQPLTPAQRAKLRAAAKNAKPVAKATPVHQGFIATTKRVNRTPIQRSGRDCIAQAPQRPAQDHANTGATSQPVVEVPIDGSTSVQNASDTARANQACSHP